MTLTVRVYGILKDNANRVLVSDEYIRGNYYTKFPGGGLEIGEGTRDCLRREFKEETNLDVTVGDHIYTTDFYQPSAFNNAHQILSIYYFVHTARPVELDVKTKVFDFQPYQVADPNGTCEAFRWIDWDDFSEDSVSLPIDKVVAGWLKKQTP